MQCEVRGMADMADSAQSGDTLPKPGRVNEVCREWVVKEDGALAYRLQSEEIEHHLSGNRWRNAVVREDFPRALDEQRRERQAAEEARRQAARLQEEEDARVAAALAERLEREEAARRAAAEDRDQHLARQLQEREMRHQSPDPNCVGLPLPPSDELLARMRALRVSGPASTEFLGARDVEEEGDVVDEYEYEDEEAARRRQEREDEELARLLQEREESRNAVELSALDRDRLIALEAQDRELAKMLQERERAKARRARERARQRAALKKEQERQQEEPDVRSAPPPAVRPDHLDLSTAGNRTRLHNGRYPGDPEAIESAVWSGSPGGNIAMAIDPTYSPNGRHTITDLSPGPALPYMPIQGQRRCPEKRSKDTCRPQ